MSTPTANNAIVAGIQGQAWARSPDGSLRALATGDTLRADDTLVLAPGARVAVAIDGAPAITFVGPDAPGTVSSLAPGEIRVPAQPAAPAAEPAAAKAAPTGSQATAAGDQPPADDVPRMGDGHGFVELVRILEVVEADGITPLTLARIQEIIPPMGMGLPDYPIDEDRWLWHQGGDLGGGRIIPPSPPLAAPDAATTPEDTPASGNVLLNDRDPNRDPITVTRFTVDGTSYAPGTVVPVSDGGLVVGTVVIHPDGQWVFTPTPDWHGTVPTIGYTVSDSKDGSADSTLDIVVTPVVDITPDTVVTHAGTPVTTPVLANDSFAGTPVVTVASGDGPGHGTVTVNADGSITYTPTPGYVGPDSYTYTVTSGGRTETTTVSIAVANTPPVAQPDTNTITEDGPALVVGAADGVIRSGTGAGMDSDADNDPLTVFGVAAGTTGLAGLDGSLVGQPIAGQYGTLTLHADGSYTYTLDNANPAVNALRNGDTLHDGFSYGITDGNDGGTAVTTLTIVIDGRTDGPPAIVPDDLNGPGDGTLTVGQVTVHEAGLRGTVPAGADKTATGSITIDAPDGLAGISVGGRPLTVTELLAISPGSPVTITTPQGTLTLTGFTPTASIGGVPTGGTLDYHYELTTPVANGPGQDQATDPIALTVSDAGGGTSSGTLVVNIVDDSPTAVDDANTVPVGSYDPVSGHLVDGTGAGAAGQDTRGADGASVTVVRNHAGVDTPVSPTGSTEIQGQYGKLIITADGSYTYTRDLGTPSDVTEVFNYTLADSDGDSDVATLTIAIGSGSPVITGLTPAASGGELSFAERHLANGSAPDPTQLSKTGSFTLASPDGVKTLTLYGTIVIANDSVVATPTVITPLGHTLEILGYDPATGVVDYRYTLAGAEPHDKATQDHDLFDDLPVLLTDHNDRTASGTLSVQIVDDTPAITVQADQLGSLTVDETAFTGGQASATDASFVRNVFGVQHGADGAAAASPLVYSLNIAAAGTASGITDTAAGFGIHLYKEGNDIVGRVGQAAGADPAGAIAFRITIAGTNPDGPVTLTQYRPLAHADDTDHDDILRLAADAVTLTATATDSDGDAVSTTAIGIGDRFSFRDDGPGVSAAPAGVTLDEAHLAHGSTPDASLTTSAIVSLNVSFGTDGAGDARFTDGATNSTTAALAAQGLVSNGQALSYVVSADGHTLTAYRGTNPADQVAANRVFSVEIVDPAGSPGYRFTLHQQLDHVRGGTMVDALDIAFEHLRITDRDGDQVETRFEARIVDDSPDTAVSRLVTVSEDSLATDASNTFNTNADATGSNTTIGSGPAAPRHGTAVVNPDGTITYTPNGNYSGTDSFTYTTVTDDETKTFTVEVTVTPSADAPQLGADRTVGTLEDTPVALGLALPVITDGIDRNGSTVVGDDDTLGDNPERIGAITLTLAGAPAGTVLVTGGTLLSAGPDGSYTIVIVGTSGGTNVDTGLHIRAADLPSANVNYLTAAEYQAIQARLAEHRHENFEVRVAATSHEVDDSGSPLGGLAGATSTQAITVAVRAVTDNVVLVFDQAVTSGATRATVDGSTVNETYSVVYGNPAAPGTELDTRATVTLREDSSFDLRNLLDASFQDLDGSELRSITIQNTTGQAILVNGSTLAVGASRTISTPGLSTSETAFPEIRIGAPGDFSGVLDGIRVTLNALDRDADSYWDGTAMVPGAPGLTGMPEAVTTDNTVVLGLHVLPRAGDVRASDVSTQEDTAVAFLAGITVTDTGTAGGSEVISRVEFDIPAGWTLSPPTAGVDGIPANGWQTSTSGSTVTISFDDGVLSEPLREQVLDGFMIRPPAHSSRDASVTVRVTTVDSRGADVDTVEKPLQIGITVTPVAERVGGNSDGGDSNADGNIDAGDDDVAMNGDHLYTTHGFEDGWFALDSDGLDLKGPWRNEDGQGVANGGSAGQGSEQTFARFTPLQNGVELDGSSFQYHDGTAWRVVHFNGTPVDIPIAYLDTAQFRGPTNFKGVVEIKVQAVTIDYDEDSNAPTAPAVSGEAWLTNLVLHPVADQVTLKVGARITALEDAGRDGSPPIALRITPSSDDPTEIFDVTIRKIPAGASIIYDGVTYDMASGLVPAGDGSYLLALPGFDPGLGVALVPPKDSNAPIQLEIEAVSIDTLSYVDQHGDPQVVTSPPSAPHVLPITITLQGVPDEPVLVIDGSQGYDEADLDSAATPNQVALRELITELRSGETAAGDTSETLTLRISDLAAGFEVLGVGPTVGVATGTDRVWVVTPAQIASGAVTIQLPPNYSGTVTFTAQPVVTENDNPSDTFFTPRNVSFEVVPAPEAELRISSAMVEDLIGHVDLSAAHRNGDTDEQIGALRIKEVPGVSFYADTAGTQPLVAVGGWYEITGAASVASIYARGPANVSGDIVLEVQYKVTDTAADGSTGPVESPWQDATHTLAFRPVTDPVELDLVAIDGAAGASAANLTAAGNLTVSLNLAKLPDPNTAGNQADYDGSERLIHILVQGVPDGVAVQGALYTGDGQWLMLLPDTPANRLTGDHPLDIVFQVSSRVGTVSNIPITITTATQDGGAMFRTEDSVTWQLSTAIPAGGDVLPSVSLTVIDAPQQEDVAFTLSEVVAGSIDSVGANVASYDLTVTLRTVPGEDVSFSNMTRTEVIENGQPVVLWTHTVTGVTDATVQAELQNALAAIEVVPPSQANGNANNLGGRMPPLDVTVTLHGNGLRSEDQVEPEVSLAPVTDPAALLISAPAVAEGEPVQITIEVANPADQAGDWNIIDGRLYLKLSGAGIPGVLSQGGTDLVLAPVSGVPGLPDGDYYVIDGVAPDTPLNLSYTPTDPFDKGSVVLQAWVQNQETGSVTLLSSGSQTLTVNATNTAPTASVTITASGIEHDGATPERTQLNMAGTVLPDAGEQLVAAFIEGLPKDFAVYYGADSASAMLASNAGGSGATSTWSIPVAGNALPAYIAIQPPAHWSGTLSDLQFYLVSGETANAPTAWPVAFDLVIAPQADGLALAPTLSFGKAGDIVALHLNAAMKDPAAASPSDGHTERTTLQLSGFPDGGKVVFYANGTALDAARVSFDGSTYTITGLSQAELDGLGFQHQGTGSPQAIDVSAWTQEVDGAGNPVGAPSAPAVTSQVTINIADKLPTQGADTLLWTGSLLDGRGGDDTIQLRFGENLSGNELAAALRNIEKIELGVTSDNTITGLDVADVFDMTDARNALEILGNGQDAIHLEGGWNNGGNGVFTGLHGGQAVTLTVQAGVETYLNGVLIE